MAWKVENPSSLFVEQACNLEQHRQCAGIPGPTGAWGIDDRVSQCVDHPDQGEVHHPWHTIQRGERPEGPVHLGLRDRREVLRSRKFAYIDSRVIRVQGDGSDHYFVAVKSGTQTGVCDITCNQFGGPDFIAGSLKDVKGPAQREAHGRQPPPLRCVRHGRAIEDRS